MFRFLVPAIALFALASSAPFARAQHGHTGGHAGSHAPSGPPGTRVLNGGLPLAPGVMPGSPFGPGTQFLPTPRAPFASGSSTRGGIATYNQAIFGANSRLALPYVGGFGYGGYYGYQDYGYDPGIPVVFAPRAWSAPSVPLANEFPATLTIELPAAKDAWVDGKPAPNAAIKGYTLTSPDLKAGEKYTFNVNVRWTRGGKTYEAQRAITVGPGEHSQLCIVSGTEVKE